MTNKVSEVLVTLYIPGLKQSNNIYCLDNIKNIITQLFVTTDYKVSIDDNDAGMLCTSGKQGNCEMVFNVEITAPEHIINNFQSWNIFGVVNLDEVVENQRKIHGNLVNTVLTGYKGSEIRDQVLLPVVRVSFSKIETADEFNSTAVRNPGSSI
ncbi:MAG: hypothetical protein H6743_02415 [Rickettsiaceae bacterium]|nr:hypothetical protein [Rickettsiaceae bacterium]